MNSGTSDDCPPSLRELVHRYARGASPQTELERVLARIEERDHRFNSFVMLNRPGAALAAAQSAQRWRTGAPLSAIDGVPISVKDMLPVAGLPSRCGSRVTSDLPAATSAPVIERLTNAGAVIVGLTTTAEFGGASVTISPLSGITRNAHDTSRSAGGSSGGAAVSVAAGFCSAAIATDTGGSIRVPAAFNGVVGLKPTGGRLPTDAASVLHTLGCPGPMATCVDDCARVFGIMAQRRFGMDDPTCPDADPDTDAPLRGLTIFASRRLGYAAWLHPEIEACFDALLSRLRASGCAVREVEPDIDDPAAIFAVHVQANHASLLRHLRDDQVAALSSQVRDARAAGLRLTAADLLDAQRARQVFSAALRQALACDLLITPMTAVPPFAADRFMPTEPELQAGPRSWNPFGYPFNLTGQPALTLPCGLTRGGLPIGCQLVAGKWQEALLLSAGRQVEQLLAAPAH